jgi:hypothetical protein
MEEDEPAVLVIEHDLTSEIPPGRNAEVIVHSLIKEVASKSISSPPIELL